jgi:hypothetical protein
MNETYDDHGIRFEYPDDWEADVARDGPRTIVSVSEPGGAAFLFVTLDADRHKPAELADEVLATMREEYKDLDAYPVFETIAGHQAVGQDFEFFCLDLVNTGFVRAFRTPRRSVLLFGQWSDRADGTGYADAFRAIRRSLAETDADSPR